MKWTRDTPNVGSCFIEFFRGSLHDKGAAEMSKRQRKNTKRKQNLILRKTKSISIASASPQLRRLSPLTGSWKILRCVAPWNLTNDIILFCMYSCSLGMTWRSEANRSVLSLYSSVAWNSLFAHKLNESQVENLRGMNRNGTHLQPCHKSIFSNFKCQIFVLFKCLLQR